MNAFHDSSSSRGFIHRAGEATIPESISWARPAPVLTERRRNRRGPGLIDPRPLVIIEYPPMLETMVSIVEGEGFVL